MTAITDVRARLARDLSLRLIHRDTAGDVQALLDHHANLQAAFGEILGYVEHKESCGDEGAYNNADTTSCGCGLDGVKRRLDCLELEVQVLETFNRPPVHYGFNCSGQVRPQLPPAIDLQQFRAAVGCLIDCAETEAELVEGNRLLALIDGQSNLQASLNEPFGNSEQLPANVASSSEHSGRSDKEIVDQTEQLARLLLSEIYQREVPADWRFREQEDLRSRHVWMFACQVQGLLTDTDPENAAAELDGHLTCGEQPTKGEGA